MSKHTVLSGIRATGRLHLGNYLGAVKGMLELQENPDYETLYMVADVHAITTPYNVEELRVNRKQVIIDYLAAGLDPEQSILFQQADVPEHLELQFYFSSVMTVARMQHLPTFKEKAKQYPENITMALLNYPVLMASDILIYKADSVPVGVDQEPHLEISREVSRKMNEQYGTDFPEPSRFKTKGAYVPSLTGEGKMSKSVEGSYINLTDSMDEILAKVKKIPTDSGNGSEIIRGKGKGVVIHPPTLTIDNNENSKRSGYSRDTYIDKNTGTESPGVSSLFKLVQFFMGDNKKTECEALYLSDKGLRYGDLKTELAEAIFAEIKPIQEKRAELEASPDYIETVIREGAEKARAIASQTVKEVKEKMGLDKLT